MNKSTSVKKIKNTSVKTIRAVGNYYKKIGIWNNLVKR